MLASLKCTDTEWNARVNVVEIKRANLTSSVFFVPPSALNGTFINTFLRVKKENKKKTISF